MFKILVNAARNHAGRRLVVLVLVLFSGLAGCDGVGNQGEESDSPYLQQFEALSGRLDSLESVTEQQTTILRQILDHAAAPQTFEALSGRLDSLGSVAEQQTTILRQILDHAAAPQTFEALSGRLDSMGTDAEQQTTILRQVLDHVAAPQTFEALSGRLDSLGTVAEQQTTTLQQILDHITPPPIPANWENLLKQLESKVGDTSQWPEDSNEAKQYFGRTSKLVADLPAWAETAYLRRLSRIRWAAMAFSRLYEPRGNDQPLHQLEALVIEMRDLAEAVPQDGSDALVRRLREEAAKLAGEVANRRVVEAIEEAQRYMKGGPEAAPDIVDVYEFLAFYEDDHDLDHLDVDIAALRKSVYRRLVQGQAASQQAALRTQWQNATKLADHEPLYEVSARMLLQQVLSAQAELVMEGIATPAYNKLETELRRAVKTIESKAAKRAEERRAQAMRSYQRWALMKIREFEASFEATSEKAAKDASILPFSDKGWNDASFGQVRHAMIVDLLPINLALLELPVHELYQQAFQKGWVILTRRKDQTAVALASALAVKKSLRAFLEDE
ncbi:MAG: hypothetical protein OXP66_01705 [Candidatus Tectomicrobia bacterium]|nr:hypothetical protein [Candidatus Tectomicrobia bacterium]